MAYVPTTGWIRNTTIQDNITFHKHFEDKWYQEVVDACELEEDILNLPQNHEFLIEQNGSNISGGQNQRLALARAAYSRSDIYVLDNPLSAVDRKTANLIYRKLLGPNGILNNSTRIIVSNDPQLLNDADCILQIKDFNVTQINRTTCTIEPTADIIYATATTEINSCRSSQEIKNQSQPLVNYLEWGDTDPNIKYISEGGLINLLVGVTFTVGSVGKINYPV